MYTPRRPSTATVKSRREDKAHKLNALPPQHPQAVDRAILPVVRHARIPKIENYRTHYGRSLSLTRIEQVLRNANAGFMAPMADLGRESISLDGHASAVLQKRLNRVTALPWRTEEATGAGVDAEKARDYNREVEAQLKALRGFRSRLKDLAWGSYDGRAGLEIEWQFVGGLWPWRVRDLHWIHPRRISFGQQRDLRIIEANTMQGNFSDRVGFPLASAPFKFVARQTRMFSDYAEREGLCPRMLYWSFFMRFGVRERMVLVELFGKPWRILEQATEMAVNDEDLEQSFEALQALGGTNTARVARGMKASVVSPDAKGEVHKDAIEHAQLIISKLVLGSTSTTDAQPAGLGSNQSEVHKTEEDLVIEADGAEIAECIEDALVDAIVILNRGPSEVINAPRFFIEPEQPKDPGVELDNIEKAANVGLAVGIDEARERTGYRAPNEGEAIIVQVHPETPLGQPAPAPRTTVVYPAGNAPAPGEIRPEPAAEINLPNQPGTPSQPSLPGLEPPQTGPDQMPPTVGNDPNTPEEARDLARKMTELGITRCEHGRPNRCPMCGVERSRDVDLDESGEPVWAVAWKAIGDAKAQRVADLEDLHQSDDSIPGRVAAAMRRPLPPIPFDALDRQVRATVLNNSEAEACPHGRRRKCRDCGVVRAKAGAPWRAMDDAGRVVL